MKSFFGFIGSVFLLGMMVWTISINVAIAQDEAGGRQLEEGPGQVGYK